MNPEDLAAELESHDADYFLELMLDAVPEDIDKRQGSIVYDALAPASQLMGVQSLALANIIRQTYIKTAQGEFLGYRAIEHGTNRYPATQTEVKAKFLDDDGKAIKNVNVGDKFASIGESPIFYTVTSINDDLTGQMIADEAGTDANGYLGQILPVTPNDALSWAEIVEITAPSRDAETDDHLRQRLLNGQNWIAYGGNIADYLDMVSKIPEVGAAQVYPTWQGPGTVKLVIVDNNYQPASATLVKQVKDKIDPEDTTAQGYGLAPIDHRVTVVAPEALKIDVTTKIKLEAQATEGVVKKDIQDMLEKFFTELRQSWNKINPEIGRGYALAVYRSKILSKIMMVDGVADATLPQLNGKDKDVALTFNNEISQLPILGEVSLNG